jgi:hypothetical protein
VGGFDGGAPTKSEADLGTAPLVADELEVGTAPLVAPSYGAAAPAYDEAAAPNPFVSSLPPPAVSESANPFLFPSEAPPATQPVAASEDAASNPFLNPFEAGAAPQTPAGAAAVDARWSDLFGSASSGDAAGGDAGEPESPGSPVALI